MICFIASIEEYLLFPKEHEHTRWRLKLRLPYMEMDV